MTDFKTISNKEDFVFYDDSKETTFNFPSIEEGAIGNLHVSRINTNPTLLSPFYFGRGIPVLNSEFSGITFPKRHEYPLPAWWAWIPHGLLLKWKTITGQIHFRFAILTARQSISMMTRQAVHGIFYATHVIFYIDGYKDEKGNYIRLLSNLDDLYKLSYGYLKNINKTISPELQNIVDSLSATSRQPDEKAKKIYS